MTYCATYSDGQRQLSYYVQADSLEEAAQKARQMEVADWRLVSVAESAEQWDWAVSWA